jgi:predicted dehydrogenase
MVLRRKRDYKKELDFRVSRSYGPGRYDTAFEQKGRDYPIGYVRWSETRNMESFLQLLADGKVDVKPLITHSFAIENAGADYDLITGKTEEPHLGVVIRYPGEGDVSRRLDLMPRRTHLSPQSHLSVGLLGAGNFAQGVLIPAIRSTPGAQLVGLCASSGARSRSSAAKFGFSFCTTDEEQIYSDASINTLVIATRHHLHAAQVLRALECGKNVFCEKPLCLNEEELGQIERSYARCGPGLRLLVGFNRRFAAMARRMKDFLSQSGGPFAMHYRVNAGSLPKEHWIEDPEHGGGRVLGEVCHFVDFLSFLCAAPPTTITARSLNSPGGQDVIVSLEFGDGSQGTISYLCSGDRAFSKERVEVFGGGSVAVLDDFRRLDLVRHGRKTSSRSWFRQDKGHAAEWKAFGECIQSGQPAPISFEEIALSTRATIRILDSLRSGRELRVRNDSANAISAPLVS